MLSQCELSPGDLQRFNPDLAGMWHDTQEEVCTQRRPEILFPVRDRGVPYQGSCGCDTVRYKRKRRRPYWESHAWSYFFFLLEEEVTSVWVVSWSHVIDIHAGYCAALQRDLLLCTRMKFKPRGALLMDFAWHLHKSLTGGKLTLSLCCCSS